MDDSQFNGIYFFLLPNTHSHLKHVNLSIRTFSNTNESMSQVHM